MPFQLSFRQQPNSRIRGIEKRMMAMQEWLCVPNVRE
jgi:hypothetical protein